MAKVLGSEFKRGTGVEGQMLAEYDGFRVSYAPSIETETVDGETALVIEGERGYAILNGDWRLAYSELAPQGVEACKNFFRNKREQFRSSWSNEEWE